MAGPLDLARLVSGPTQVNPKPVMTSTVEQGDELAADRGDHAPVIELAAEPDHDCRPGFPGGIADVGQDLPNRSSFGSVIGTRDNQIDTVMIGQIDRCGLGQSSEGTWADPVCNDSRCAESLVVGGQEFGKQPIPDLGAEPGIGSKSPPDPIDDRIDPAEAVEMTLAQRTKPSPPLPGSSWTRLGPPTEACF